MRGGPQRFHTTVVGQPLRILRGLRRGVIRSQRFDALVVQVGSRTNIDDLLRRFFERLVLAVGPAVPHEGLCGEQGKQQVYRG